MWVGKMLEALGNPFPAELVDKANVQELLSPFLFREFAMHVDENPDLLTST
jgi:hypothetical protein